MLSRFRWLLVYFLLWSFWFEGSRLIFLLYQWALGTPVLSADWPPILLHGYRMDLSVAAYVSLLPGLWLVFAPTRWLYPVIRTYTIFLVILASLLTTVDLEVYRAWGFRLDTTPLNYLKMPTEALASVQSSPFGWLISILIGLIGSGIWVFTTINRRLADRLPVAPARLTWSTRLAGLPTLLATALLIIPLRGGLQQIPMNVSAVFFSPHTFANYAAITPHWNFIQSCLEQNQYKDNPFRYLPEAQARQTVRSLYQPVGNAPSLLNMTRPNVLLIIWESFTAKSVAALGGRAGITPQFERLSQEGLFFNQLYASGPRSDKGLIAVLSGFPAQPTASIMKIPTKAAKLPTLSQVFKKAGYQTSFYYGGETEFDNIKSYLFHSEYDRIVSKPDFQAKDWNSKWGAHDHVVYNRILADLHTAKQPFFSTFFTLSSHEPFEVPMPTVIPGEDEESLFLNAVYYSDRSLGQFIAQARKQPWWNNTLIIVLADHGHRLPMLSTDKVRDFHIPMLWLGGALKARHQVIDRVGSQTDLAATLLHQLRLDASAFTWSRDLLNFGQSPFAYFSFNNGFGIVQPDRHLVFDNTNRQLISAKGPVSRKDIELGEAYEEISFQDFLNK